MGCASSKLTNLRIATIDEQDVFLINKERAKTGDNIHKWTDRGGGVLRNWEEPFPLPALPPPIGRPRTMTPSEHGFSQLGSGIIMSISHCFMKGS